MNFKKHISFLSFFVFLFLVSLPTSVSAKFMSNKDGTVTIAKDEVVDEDLFVGATNVEIYGTVNGDVYAAGESVKVDGVINGDVHIAGADVKVGGVIDDDVYVGAGNVDFTSAFIGGSVIAGSGMLTFDSETIVDGSVISGAGQFVSKAFVGKNLYVGAGDLTLNSEVGGEVRIAGGNITVGDEASVGKDLYYMQGDEEGNVSISKEASISGMTTKVMPSGEMQRSRDRAQSFQNKFHFGLNLLSFLGVLLVGFIGLKLLPKQVTEISENVSTKTLGSLGWGFLVTLLILPFLFVLVLTGVGIPLAGILFLVFILESYFAKLFVGFAVGKFILTKAGYKNMNLYLVMFAGMCVVYFVKAIPVLGFFASLSIWWIGLGAQVLYKKAKLQTK